MPKNQQQIFVALLRGINVGGNNMIPMKELSAKMTAAHFESVRTYIQSGNILFRADAKRADELPSDIAALIKKHFKLEVPVVVRTQAELSKLASAHPFEAVPGANDKTLNVAFLSGTPLAEHVALLDPTRSPQDHFRVVGRDIFLFYGGGVAGTKLTNAYFDSKLKVVTTVRNWKTVRTLAELAAE